MDENLKRIIIDTIRSTMIRTPETLDIEELTAWLNGYSTFQSKFMDILKSIMKPEQSYYNVKNFLAWLDGYSTCINNIKDAVERAKEIIKGQRE